MTEIFRLTEMKNQTGSAEVISEYRSEYLLNGQKSKEDSDITGKDGKKSKKTATYTYDLIGRLTKETRTGSEDISYTYDSNNNRKEMKAGNKVTAYKYNKNDELLRTDTLNTSTEEDSTTKMIRTETSLPRSTGMKSQVRRKMILMWT